MFFDEARGRRAVSAFAVGVLLTASALPSAYALFRCRMSGELEAAPCCGHKESVDTGGHAAVRATPCCERVTFQIEHIPGAESPASRPQAALLGLVLAILGAPSATPCVSAVAVNRGPAANSAGPPIFLETCSLLI